MTPISLVTFLLLLIPFVFSAGCPSSSWSLQFCDDFNRADGETIETEYGWFIDTGYGYSGGAANWGTGEVEYTSNSRDNVVIHNNNLMIIPTKDGNGNWVSGRIETQGSWVAPEGKAMHIEASIYLPDVNGQDAIGYWPAFWALGEDYRGNYQNWPYISEFDIMENVNGDDNVRSTLHCGTSPDGPCHETAGIFNDYWCAGGTCKGNWHTYGFTVDRAAARLDWYVDGQPSHTVYASEVGDDNWNEISNQPHFILLDVAIGGSFPNFDGKGNTPLDSTVPGRAMYVDYVAVWYSP